nr:secreted RxLR effector protein 124-like [Hydra vulgaris]
MTEDSEVTTITTTEIYYITEILKNYGYNDNFENKVDFAVEIDRFDLIKYLHSKGYKGYKGTKDAINNAAMNGHLEVIKYLHELGYKGTKDAINNAAMNGHLEVIKYLHELRYKGTKDAINNAVVDGYLDVVKYLISLNYKVNETDFMCAAM